MAIDAFSIILAFITNPATFIFAMNVQRLSIFVHFFLIMAFGRMSITIARLTFKWIFFRITTPRFLDETFRALVTVAAGCVVLALALEKIGRVFGWWADVGVPVTYTATTDGNFFDTVVVL